MRKVVKILFVVAMLVYASVALAYQNPGKPTGFVNDFASIISTKDKSNIETKLSAFEKETGDEISVVTINSLGGDTIENFAVNLFQDWGIGKKESDNGLLLLIAPNDNQVRIEVGYGLEPMVTDAESSVIINKIMIPAFKVGDYSLGISNSLDKIIGLIKNDPETIKFINDNSSNSANTLMSVLGPLTVLLIIIALLSTRGGRRLIPFIIFNSILGGRNDRGSGGFGGFGGGSSGGGGASGRW